MANGETLPLCEPFPKATLQLPQIEVFGGAKLQAHADFTTGLPSECSSTLNLFSQLSPLMGSMDCVLKILKVVLALQKFAKSPLTEASALLKAIADLAKCFVSVTPAGIAVTVSGIVQLIIKLFSCTLEEVIRLGEMRFEIQVNRGVDPVLDGILDCATGNVDASISGVLKSLEPVLVLFEIIAEITGEEDLITALDSVTGLIKCPDLNFDNVDLSLENPFCEEGSPFKPLCDILTVLEGIEATFQALGPFNIFGHVEPCPE